MFSSEMADNEAVAATRLVHRVSLPAEFRPGLPLAVLVHGRAGNGSVMWPFSKVFRSLQPLVIVSPEAFVPDEIGGFSWWSVEGGRERSARGRATKEDVLPATAKLEHFIHAATALYQTSTTDIFGLGFSQGGAVLAALALQNPELFRGVGMLASFVPTVVFEEEELINSRLQNRELIAPPFFWAHGTKDEVIPIDKARPNKDRLAALGGEVEWVEEEVGHKVGSGGLKALESWIERQVPR